MQLNFNKITIIGTGFMGGSLAKAIKKKGLSSRIVGYTRNKERERKIKKLKIFDEVYSELSLALNEANLIILATPVSSIIEYIKILGGRLQNNCIITDIGSTKEIILKEARKYLKDNFVGSHPLCGSEKKGAEFSSDSLFENALCILTPIKKNRAFWIIKEFWKRLGCNPLVLDEKTHDKILAYTSGLPHILSFSLTATVPFNFSDFIATSFKDMTRISGSPPEVWTDIFLSNRFIRKSLKDFLKQINKLDKIIEKKDRKKLYLLLNRIVRKYKSLLKV